MKTPNEHVNLVVFVNLDRNGKLFKKRAIEMVHF
jgi:hypothetical protein